MSEFTIDPARYAAIDLKQGSHATPGEGMCLMEAAAFLVGERHSDNPNCVSLVLGTFGRNLNDVLPDDLRQNLKGLIPALPGTANDEEDGRRSYMALDWLIRTWLPAWLNMAPSCREDAQRVRQLDRIVDLASAQQAGPVVREAQKRATAAGVNAGAGAWGSVRAVVGNAAWDAARDAAATVAWDATGAIAGAAARAAHGAVAAASQGIAEGALVATVRELQLSAIDLYAEMIAPELAGCDGGHRVHGCGNARRATATRHRREQRSTRTRTMKSTTRAPRGRKSSDWATRGRRRMLTTFFTARLARRAGHSRVPSAN